MFGPNIQNAQHMRICSNEGQAYSVRITLKAKTLFALRRTARIILMKVLKSLEIIMFMLNLRIVRICLY
jgi:hypothetical protein